MTFDAKTTAVVLIEYQNDFTSDGGGLHGAVSEVMTTQTGMLERTCDVVAAARNAGAAVMHAPITFAEGYGEITNHPSGIFKMFSRPMTADDFIGRLA